MLRYLRIYAACIRFAFAKALMFRVDFFFRVLMDIGYYTVNLLFFQVIMAHTPAIAGWTEPKVMIFVAFYLVVDAVVMVVFSNGLWQMSGLINKGDLDYYLIRPVSSFFLVTMRDFACNSVINLAMALGILWWAIERNPAAWSLLQSLQLTVLLINASVLFFLLQFLFVLPTFWNQSSRGMMPVFWMLTKFQERPDRIFTGPLRVVLTTIMPLSVISSFPARLLLDGWNWPIFLHICAVSVGLWTIALWLWGRGLRAYTSASS